MGSDKAVVVVKSTGQRTRQAEPSALTTPVLSDNGTEPVWIEGDDLGGGGGDITTDVAWAAKGDLIAGTGNDTAAILTVGTNGKVLSADSGQTTGLNWVSPSGMASGSAFPGSPSSGDLFYRTDLHLECFYDGTRWLTLSQYDTNMSRIGDASEPQSATKVNQYTMALGQTLYIEELYIGFYVNGGTALSGSHKWVVTLRELTSAGTDGTASTIATINIDSGTSSIFRQASATGINTATLATDSVLNINVTKTGTPGTLYLKPLLRYRRILT